MTTERESGQAVVRRWDETKGAYVYEPESGQETPRVQVYFPWHDVKLNRTGMVLDASGKAGWVSIDDYHTLSTALTAARAELAAKEERIRVLEDALWKVVNFSEPDFYQGTLKHGILTKNHVAKARAALSGGKKDE